MPSPKTATITMIIVNDDGSKTIVETAELDAQHLPNNPYSRNTDAAEHILIGVVDPFYDESNRFDRRDIWADKFREPRLVPRETHFNLQLQLPPVDANKHVYTIREVEAPLTRVVAYYNQTTKKVQITQYEEGGASNNIQDTAAIFKDSIYFFLDIP